jgi:hypothetical protein
VIKAWAFSQRVEATQRAERLLKQMIQLSETGALSDVFPNVRTYTTMILCYGLSRKKGAPQRADELFQTMLKLHENGKLDAAPSKIAYTTLRKAWSTSKERNKKVRVAEIESQIVKKFGSYHLDDKTTGSDV